MELKIEIPTYIPEQGIKYNWENNFIIDVKIDKGIVSINANKEGLISLANHLLNLSQESVPSGCHLHFDDYNSLEEGSTELIIQKM